ncbi:GNAT family N-acetyltransferase [Paludifilum halophilum]|uniref:GNAT family N-acetyltransferase n=1 Tax=Paludifilum halophilum TaxID=1642702 RepID=UPI00146ABA19|nr:GNAT family protein [Paludifilum halophilum]
MLTLYAETPIRLTLLERRHAPILYRLVETNRTHLQPWLTWVNHMHSLADMESYILRSLSGYACQREAHFGVWWGQWLAGSVTVERIDPVNRVAEIGYWLDQRFTGRGVMSRSVSRLVDYLFDERHINRVEIRTVPANRASRAVARRLGLHYEGTLRQAGYSNGVFVDHELYGLLRSDWKLITGSHPPV